MFGDEHPDTLSGMANLASTYTLQGQWLDAAALEETVVKLRTRKIGAEHPDTLRAMHKLALTYEQLMELQSAEALELEVLSTRMKVLGHTHPDTLDSVSTLVHIRDMQREQSYSFVHDDQVSIPESVSEGTDGAVSASSMTSLSNDDQGASLMMEDILTSDPNLISLYLQLAGSHQTRFLRMMRKQFRLLFDHLQIESPAFLKRHINILFGGKRRQQRVLSGICDRLKLFQPPANMAKALNEAQSEELSTNTIQWIEHVSRTQLSETTGLSGAEQPEIDANEIAYSESDSDDSDEEVHEQSYDALEQAKSFVAGSSSLVSHKHRIEMIIDPHLDNRRVLIPNSSSTRHSNRD